MAAPYQALFSAAELEIGCGLPPRGIELLKRENLHPAPVREAVRGGRPLWDFDALARDAVIGALFSSLASLLIAARLGNAIYEGYYRLKGRPPTRFNYYIEIARHLTADDTDDVAVHRRLREHPEIYKSGEARDDDFRIFIVDRRYVFSGSTKNIPIASPFGGPRTTVAPEFRINGWPERGAGGNIEVIPFVELLPPGWEEPDDIEAQKRAAEVEAAWTAAWRNATSTTAINVSLAVRNALDRVYDRRQAG